VTICTTNTVDLNKLKRAVTPLKEELDAIEKMEAESRLNKFYQKSQVLEDYVQKSKGAATISDFLSFSPENVQFIGEVHSDHDKLVKLNGYRHNNGLKHRCTNLYRIRSVEKEGTCFTLFHEAGFIAADTHGALDEDNFNDRENIFSMFGLPSKVRHFSGHQLLEFNLDFQSQSYTGIG
jgi:hypothetical protein